MEKKKVHGTQPVETQFRTAEQKDYWVDRIGGYLPVLEVPLDYPRSPGSSNFRATEAIAIDRQLCLELEKLLRTVREKSEKVTLFAVMLAAFKVVLHRYTGLEDIVVGGLAYGSGKIGNPGNTTEKKKRFLPVKIGKFISPGQQYNGQDNGSRVA